MLETYLSELLGNRSVAVWLVCFTFIIIGVLLSLIVSAKERNKDSPNTPYKFSFKFLVHDNILRILGSVLIAFTVIRFGEDMVGAHIGYFGSLLMGLCFDQLVKFIAEWQKKARDIFTTK